MADTKSYSYTKLQLDVLQLVLASHNLNVNLSSPGEISDSGWDISWSFPDSTHISITVNRHPFAEEGFFWSKLNDVFKYVQI